MVICMNENINFLKENISYCKELRDKCVQMHAWEEVGKLNAHIEELYNQLFEAKGMRSFL